MIHNYPHLTDLGTVQSLYNTPHYNKDLDIHGHVVTPNFFYHGILQKNARKMTIKWSFSYNSFIKLPLYNTIHL